MAGRGHCQLHPKLGKLLAVVGVVEMVRFRGICSPKQCASYPSCGTALRSGTNDNGGNPARSPQRTVAGTARRKGVLRRIAPLAVSIGVKNVVSN